MPSPQVERQNAGLTWSKATSRDCQLREAWCRKRDSNPDPIITNDVLYQLSYCGRMSAGLASATLRRKLISARLPKEHAQASEDSPLKGPFLYRAPEDR